ncbi:hypothetical protein [Microbispora amethystogenes]|nr:hypothetical protein [Microbispora amethystogenes]
MADADAHELVAGYLVSVYGLSVAVGALVLTAGIVRWRPTGP